MIIKAGEWLTNKEGERYAQAVEDVMSGMIVSADQFVMADGSKPVTGRAIPQDVLSCVNGVVVGAWIDGNYRAFSERGAQYDVVDHETKGV